MNLVTSHAAGPLAPADWVTVLRLSLHVIGACVWVGGQFVLGALMPTVRTLGEGAPRTIARAFGKLSWPGFWLLVATGVWNYAAMDTRHATGAWNVEFGVKMLCVVLAGLAGFMHTRAKDAKMRGTYAGLSALASIAALVLGVAIAG